MVPGMLHRRKELKSSRGKEKYDAGDVIRSTRGGQITALDINNAFKRSGTHSLDRAGYHEEKCRNVLVRYCAHIPRNFQYKDGIQQIFLILREHLGDENLDLAGGVLYELIEVDCDYTDDPGAAFQRWKHDHLRRYADLELPHVPHMTTITSSIIPTQKLSQWRSKHPDRYPFVLSDSSPSSERASTDPSCIRNRKAWLIDHTLYISSRNDGTRPLNSPNPKEFHEMQWNHERGTHGKLVEERDILIDSPDCPSLMSPPETADTLPDNSKRRKGLRRYSPGSSLLDKVISKSAAPMKQPEVEQRRHSWIADALMFETASLFREKRTNPDVTTVPLPEGCQLPNAIFARKHLLVEGDESLPPYLPLKQMPIAESKATDTIVEAAAEGLLDGSPPWSFRGPFTPQLGFDGGLDYQWNFGEPTITFRRFDIDASIQDVDELRINNEYEDGNSKRIDRGAGYQRMSTKRQGVIFNLGRRINDNKNTNQLLANYTTSSASTSKTISIAIPRGFDEIACGPPQLDEPSVTRTRGFSTALLTPERTSSAEEGYLRYAGDVGRQDSLLFKNVEFTMPTEVSRLHTSAANRKTTVIELSASQVPAGFDLDHSTVLAEECT